MMPAGPASRFIFVQAALTLPRFDVFFNRPAARALLGDSLQAHLAWCVRTVVLQLPVLIQRSPHQKAFRRFGRVAFFRKPYPQLRVLIHQRTLTPLRNRDPLERRRRQRSRRFRRRNRFGLGRTQRWPWPGLSWKGTWCSTSTPEKRLTIFFSSRMYSLTKCYPL